MNIALIGITGHIEYVFQTAAMRSDVRIVAAAVGNREENISPFAARMQEMQTDLKIYADWRVMLNEVHPDMVSVAPWFCYAADIAIECLKRGIHVYCEKPLATTLDKLNELAQVWERSGCALDGMFGLRYAPWFVTVRQAIESGKIGQVRQIHAQKSYRLGKRGALYHTQALYGGILPWVGIHAMDWAMQLGGACTWVHGLHSRVENRGHGELEVSSAALMELQDGVIATVTADFLRPTGSARHDDDRLRVTGTKGMLEAMDGQVWLENDQPKRLLTLEKTPAPMTEFLDAIGTPHSAELTHMALEVTRAALSARDTANTKNYPFF